MIPRLHLFEIEDEPWCPRWLRDAMTDYLAAAHRRAEPYAAAADVLAPLLRRTGTTEIVDLGSGGGGPWPQLLPRLRAHGLTPRVRLTDLHPNDAAAARLAGTGLDYVRQPVAALAVPAAWRGWRTLFSSLHHFRPQDARALLRSARDAGVGITAFEATHRSLPALLAMLLLPLAVWIATPFVRPRRLSRFVFTYLVPILPLGIWWDGTVSCLRTYRIDELRDMVADLAGDDYRWETRELRVARAPFPITVLIGEPLRAAKDTP